MGDQISIVIYGIPKSFLSCMQYHVVGDCFVMTIYNLTSFVCIFLQVRPMPAFQVTLQLRHKWARWRLKSPASRLFT